MPRAGDPDTHDGACERAAFEPGQWVVHTGQPDWGIGQVQSAIGRRVTVMFEEAGKVVIDTGVVTLRAAD